MSAAMTKASACISESHPPKYTEAIPPTADKNSRIEFLIDVIDI
jgi:hypothetical protein